MADVDERAAQNGTQPDSVAHSSVAVFSSQNYVRAILHLCKAYVYVIDKSSFLQQLTLTMMKLL
jgi:hypothetical protein